MEFTNIESFLKYYSKVKKRTRRLLDYIPADKIEWTYAEGKFTMGDIIRHLANAERFMFQRNIQGKPSAYQGCGPEYASGLENVIQYYEDQQMATIQLLQGMTTEDFFLRCTTPGGADITIWKWLRLMLEHEIHHRGQLYVYLGMLSIEVPPLYGLTSEQLIEYSVHDT